MKRQRLIAFLLALVMLFAVALPVNAAGVNGYYNVDYLEGYAAAAYGETELGATWTKDATTFKVWSPVADRVQVRLFRTGSDDEVGAGVIGTYDMTMDQQTGIWSVKLTGDYKNVYYTYFVTCRGRTAETRDIYAKAAGVNGYRSMVVDLDATDPTGWANDKHVLLEESTDAVIWEIHVRDFSISTSSGVTAANRGKYLAFTEANTTLNGTAGEVSTCVNYLKEMGVNTVHLLPVYDFGSVDETITNDPTNRNWGYDPINYNVPEGSYSTNPYDGNVRIKEFKQMVQALHNAGISVVMDVVYNHTYDVDSYEWGARLLYNNAFNDTVPGYYHRRYDETGWYNGSGCGNVTASDKQMYQKYMVESVLYWATEYHIDGFRFDLMGCHDVPTMNLIRSELDKLDGGEGRKILMYGEPWTGGDAGIANGATQNGAQNYQMNERIAMFCDWMRDAIKGNPDGDTTGWIQGNTDGSKTDAIWGGINANDGRLTARSQTVTYADAHDNLILWDKLVRSHGGTVYNDYSSANAKQWLKELRLAETILMVSQGLQFQVAGTEFARNKQGDHNSYKSPDSVNAIDWNIRKTNADSAEYYKGLIAIRKAFSPFTDPVNQYTKNPLEGADDNCIAYWVPNDTAGEWSRVAVILNNSGYDKTVSLPEGDWTVLANGEQAGTAGFGTAAGTYTVHGFTGVILAQGSYTPKQATRIAYSGSEKLYADLGAVEWWCNDGAVTKAYFFGEGGDAWSAAMTQVSGTVYSTAIPAGNWTNVILVRLDPAKADAGWDGRWNQTGDIALQDGKNFIKSFADGSADATWDVYGGTTPVDPQPSDGAYYLVGWINGADSYGTDLKFVNNKLTATFSEDSYVFVQQYHADESITSFMTKGWAGQVSSATLYSVTANPDYPEDDWNKLYVPKGVEVTFTLSDVTATQMTLSYTTGGSTPVDPQPSDGDYYLVGWINGADYGSGDDYANLGSYKFVDGKLTATFAQDSYVMVKTGDNAHWYMTDGWAGYVSSATLYDADKYALGENADKLYVPGNREITFTLTAGPKEDTLTLSYTTGGFVPIPYTPTDHTGADDKVILHCWNWSYAEIVKYLPQIKAAGYTAVQTSPAQPHSGYKSGEIGTGDWWMLYQPLGLHIAKSNESWLGGVNELKKLCTEAHKLGVEVIVDVVANHICNGYNDIAATGTDPYADSEIIASQGGKNGYRFETLPDSRVKNYNPELFTESLTRYFRGYVFCNDETTEAVVHGNIGMPDFRTEEPVVQQSVLAYLKELIDAGVDGFRFDAAKHIETPNDGGLSSNFWPTVINGAKTYATSKGKEIWAYGEVLSTAGKTRKMNDYAPYLDMTEISYAYTITEAFGDGKGANTVANQLFKDWLGVGVEDLANNSLVLMAESHDMYAQSKGSFSRYDATVINKAWAVATARMDTSSLYFARPQGYKYGLNASDPSAGYPVGTLGKCEDFSWMNPEVGAVNAFHTAFVGSEEQVYASGNYVVVERFDDTRCGAVLVNAGGNTATVSITVNHLADGTYYDQITENEFTVTGGRLSGQMGTTGIVVLRSSAPDHCEHAHTHTTTTEATCTEPGYRMTVCDDCGRTIAKEILSPALGHVDANKDGYCDRCGTYLNCIAVYFVDTNDWVSKNDNFTVMYSYAFSDNGAQNASWPGVEATCVGRTTDGHGIWKTELDPQKYTSVIFNNIKSQTTNLPFAKDAGTSLTVVYTAEASGSSGSGGTSGGSGVYLIGTMTDWKPKADYQMTAGENGEYVIENVSLPAGAGVKVYDQNTDRWYPDGMGNEFVVEQEGAYSVSFFAEGGKDGYYEGFFKLTRTGDYVAPTSPAEPEPASEGVAAKPGAELTQICAHTAYAIVRCYNQEGKVCDCCGLHFDVVEVEDVGPMTFKDVKNPKDYFTTPVYWAVAAGITTGTSATTFSPNTDCSRAQVVTFLWRAAGCPTPSGTGTSFSDVKPGQWYTDAVTWAVEQGITTGTGNGKFSPDMKCTRAQIVTFLYRYAGSPKVTLTTNFSDVKLNDYFAAAVAWAVKYEITTGTGNGKFSPNMVCSRAQVVTFLYRMAQKEAEMEAEK